MILHKILKPFLWILTGCRFDFFGISAGTALSVGVGAAGALGNGLASSSAGKAGQKASWAAYMQQLAAMQNSSNAQERNATIVRDQNQAYNQYAYDQTGQIQGQMYGTALEGNNQDSNYQNTANALGLQYGTDAINQSYKALMGGAGGSRDALNNGATGAYNAQMGAATARDANYNDAFKGIQGYYDPYMKAGTGALSSQQDLMGLNGKAAQDAAFTGLQNGQYTELAKQGENSLLQNAAATGGVRGGNTAAALAQFRPAMMQNIIDKQTANLAGMSNQGLNASNSLAGYRSDLGNQLAGVNADRGNFGATYKTALGNNNSNYALRVGDLGSQKATQFDGLKTANANRTADIGSQWIKNQTALTNQNYGNILNNYLGYINGNRQNAIDYSNGTNGYQAQLFQQMGQAGANQAQQAGGYNQSSALGWGNAMGQGLGALAGLFGGGGGSGSSGGGGGGGSGSWGVPSGYGSGGYGFAGLH